MNEDDKLVTYATISQYSTNFMETDTQQVQSAKSLGQINHILEDFRQFKIKFTKKNKAFTAAYFKYKEAIIQDMIDSYMDVDDFASLQQLEQVFDPESDLLIVPSSTTCDYYTRLSELLNTLLKTIK